MPRQERTKSGTGIYHVMFGMKNDGTFGMTDDLTISYDGNQLVKVTDHLGSTRMVVDSNDNIKETISYYPFGSEMRMENPAQMQQTDNNWHPFRFTGKELDKQNGLNMYDFGARMFDVAGVPMWTSIDPLAEKYYHVSPYAYCGNNPIMFIDPDGKFFGPGDMFAKLDDAAKDFGKCYNNISIKKNKEYSTSFYKKTLPNGEVNYSYVEPTEGGAAGSSAKIYIKRDANGKATATNNVTNEKAVATGHTHGAYDKDYHIGNDIFSGTTKDGKPLVGDDERKKVKDSTKDIGSSNVSGIQDYVVTPNGSLQNYNPATGSVRLVSQDMPKDINDPNKVDDAMKMYK